MKIKLAIMAAAIASVFSVSSQAATIGSVAGIEADIVASGNFNNSGTEGALGLSYLGKEWVQWGTHSSWSFLNSSLTGPVDTFAGANPLGASVIASSPTAFVFNGAFGALTFTQLTTLVSPHMLAVTVSLTNNTGADIAGVQWGVGVDPDGNLNTGGGYNTVNTILGQGGQASVSAYANSIGQSLTLENTTSASAFSVSAFINSGDCCAPVNPSIALGAGQLVGFSTNADDSISLAYDIGTIHAGQTVTIGYDYNMATATPEPETYAMFMAGLGVMGFIARRRKNGQS